MALNNQVTGNVGLYYCCYRLSLLGWNVMPTSRNARGIDIVAYSENGKTFRSIQVKSLSKRAPVSVGTSLDKVAGEFWVIVNRIAGVLSGDPTVPIAKQPTAYILSSAEVKDLAHPSGTGDKVTFWIEPKDYDKDAYKEKWEKINTG
jgi:hypothetical protein